tara:strand:+ start:312 stop:1751 length:1440 start_codon:yes stop_codon:yes gene_type:complete
VLAPPSKDLFCDLASLALLTSASGGQLYHVPGVEPTAPAATTAALAAAVRSAVVVATPCHVSDPADATTAEAGETSEEFPACGYDAVLRVRCSTGLQPSHVWAPPGGARDEGSAISGALALPRVGTHSTFALTLTHAKADAKKDGVAPLYVRAGCAFVQSVLLYTSPGGERRIRVLTRPLQVVDSLPRLIASVHLPSCLALQAKLLCVALAKTPAKEAAEALQAEAIRCVGAQRQLLPPPLRRVGDAMFLSSQLALLPLFTLALARLPALQPLAPQRLSPDAAAAQLLALRSLPPHLASRLLLPRLLVLHQRSEGDGWAPTTAADAPPTAAAADPPPSSTPAPAPSSSSPSPSPPSGSVLEVPMPRAASIKADGVYLLDSTESLVLWVGAQASPSFVQALFGTDKPTDDAAPLAASANAHAATLHALLARLQAERPQHAPLRVVAQGSQLQQQLFFGRLHAEGYEGFAMHLHGRDVASR